MRTATVRKVKRGWRVYVYGVDKDDREPGKKSISRTFKTKAVAVKAAKNQRQKKFHKDIRKAGL